MSKNRTFKKWAVVNKETGELEGLCTSRAGARYIKGDNEKIVRCTVKLD